MKPIRIFTILLLCLTTAVRATIINESEPADTTRYDKSSWQRLSQGVHFGWSQKDSLIRRHDVPKGMLCQDTVIYAWQGERISLEGLSYSSCNILGDLVLSASSSDKHLKPKVSWLRYVQTDDFSTCGYHPNNLPVWTVADIIDNPNTLEGRTLQMEACDVRPFWFSLEVPQNCKAGEYKISVKLSSLLHEVSPDRGVTNLLSVKVVVLDRTLPEPSHYNFHLDLWQQPYSVARYYGVQPWSKEHFRLLRPYMKELARMGQKVASAILFYEPWGQQSNDKFQPMIRSTRLKDGTWQYDYTVFDKWIRFMQDCGIKEQIDCYSMIPWDMRFEYYDEALGRSDTLKTKTTDKEYKELWTSFLQSFAQHLHKKGWFDRTCIAMDERGLEDMKSAYQIAQEAVPGIRMSLAGNLHEELVDKLYDYAIAYGQVFTEEERAQRKKAHQHSTVYTCCTDAHPGLFSNSNPSDATWIPLYCAAAQFDGWLHWSWINWTDNPLRDSRFFLFAPGDTYLFYPGALEKHGNVLPRSSVRHERLLEGIQQFEKIKLLQNGSIKTLTSNLPGLNAALQEIEKGAPKDAPSLIQQVNTIEKLVNE